MSLCPPDQTVPDLVQYDCRPYSEGTAAETCNMTNNGATTWYIGVQGYQAGDYTVTATLMTPGMPGESCRAGMVYDCAGNCVDESRALSWIGDGYCDDGTWGMVLICPAFNDDGGDCI